MELIVLKSLELENAVSRFRSRVAAMQMAINVGSSVEEVNAHYACVKTESQIVSKLLAEVQNGCFQIAAKYHFEWEE